MNKKKKNGALMAVYSGFTDHDSYKGEVIKYTLVLKIKINSIIV